MKKLFLLLLAATAQAVTLPLYIETDTNTVVSPDSPTTLAGYGITDGGLPTSAGDGSFLVGDGAGGWVDESGDTAQESMGVQTVNGGGTAGYLATTDRGGSVGNGASSDRGGAVGEGATSIGGGAVGDAADTTSGGAIGSSSTSTTGGAVGQSSLTTTGGSVGKGSASTTGGAIGDGAFASNGFGGGEDAKALSTDSVQLGTGTNATIGTIQFLTSGSITAAEFGQLSADTQTITATTYTALVTDGAILANNAAGVTITLPTAASVPSNYRLSIINIGSIGAITVDGNGSETIDGELTIILTTQYESVTLVTDGSNWFIL